MWKLILGVEINPKEIINEKKIFKCNSVAFERISVCLSNGNGFERGFELLTTANHLAPRASVKKNDIIDENRRSLPYTDKHIRYSEMNLKSPGDESKIMPQIYKRNECWKSEYYILQSRAAMYFTGLEDKKETPTSSGDWNSLIAKSIYLYK